ncbi:MAG: ATP-binding protein, partial [Erysipelotrichaceae bacterium]
MATTEQIRSLIKAYANRNDQDFKTVVLQIAAHEARKGHQSAAQELKDDVSSISFGQNRVQYHIVTDEDSLLQKTTPSIRKEELIVSDEVMKKIDRILMEYNNRRKLYSYGLTNRRKILLEGKPGTGKTMTASVIASSLHLPLYTVQTDKMMTKYMGESGKNLRQIFIEMEDNIGVYFFDEFDAIGADRSLDNDVGEVRRILNSFLQFIENVCTESIIIAATNNLSMLDSALFRRFDEIINYDLPDAEQISRLFEIKLSQHTDHKAVWTDKVIAAAKGMSQAELTIAADDALKEKVLYDHEI